MKVFDTHVTSVQLLLLVPAHRVRGAGGRDEEERHSPGHVQICVEPVPADPGAWVGRVPGAEGVPAAAAQVPRPDSRTSESSGAGVRKQKEENREVSVHPARVRGLKKFFI